MTKRTLRVLAFAILLGLASVVLAGKEENTGPAKKSTIIDMLVNEFKTKNEKINAVHLQDIRWASSSKVTGYILIARGYREEQKGFEGNWDDELFGFFAVDQRLSRILKTIDIVPTPRWNDYWYKVEGQATWDEVTIEGVDGYGSTKTKKYDLKTVPWPGFIAPNK